MAFRSLSFFQLYLFIYFGCAGSSLLLRLLSSCSEQGLLSRCSVWASHRGGFACCGVWALGRAGSGAVVHRSIAVAHGLTCSAACGVTLEGSNLCPLHCQADSLPLSHQVISPFRSQFEDFLLNLSSGNLDCPPPNYTQMHGMNLESDTLLVRVTSEHCLVLSYFLSGCPPLSQMHWFESWLWYLHKSQPQLPQQ